LSTKIPSSQPERIPPLQASESKSQKGTAEERKQENSSVTQPSVIRNILIAIILVSACAELAYTTVNISAMPVYITYGIHLAPQWVAIAATSFILVEGVLKSPFGLLGDRLGRKPLILAGPIVSIFTCLLTPHIANPFVLVGLRILDGLGAAALWPATFSLIGDFIPEKRRAMAMSCYNLSYLVGLALGPVIGGVVNEYAFNHLHWTLSASKTASFYVATGLFALTSLAAMGLIPAGSGKYAEAHSEAHSEGGFSFHDFRLMLNRMPMTLLMTFVTFLGIGLIMAYVKLFAMDWFGISESRFGVLLITPALVIAALSIPLGTLGDRIGKAQAVKIGIGLCAFSYWLILMLSTTRDTWPLIAFGSTLGLGFVIAFPAWMALVITDCLPGQRGAAVGAVGTAQGLGAICGVGISAFLYKLHRFQLGPITIPHHGMPFLFCGIMLLVSFFMALTVIHNPRLNVESATASS